MATNIMCCFPWTNRFTLFISEKMLAKYLLSLNNYSLFFSYSLGKKIYIFTFPEKKAVSSPCNSSITVLLWDAIKVLYAYFVSSHRMFKSYVLKGQDVIELTFTASSRTFLKESSYICMYVCIIYYACWWRIYCLLAQFGAIIMMHDKAPAILLTIVFIPLITCQHNERKAF